MASNYNRVILMGRLTSDPKSGQLPSGTAVCDFGLAVNRQWKDVEGQTKEEGLFIDCAAYGKTAETIGAHFRKGRPIHVEGHLKLDTWDQDGSRRSKIRAVVDQFRFVDSRGKDESAASEPQAGGTKGRGRGSRVRTDGRKANAAVA